MIVFSVSLFDLPPLLRLLAGVGFLMGLAFIFMSLRWVCQDAERRQKDGMIVATIVFLCGYPLSLLVWMAFRPELPKRKFRG
jgi:hypothetical protein